MPCAVQDCKSALLDGMPAEEARLRPVSGSQPSSAEQFQVRQGEADTEIEYTRYTNKEVQAIPRRMVVESGPFGSTDRSRQSRRTY